jgi:hypothetical protein
MEGWKHNTLTSQHKLTPKQLYMADNTQTELWNHVSVDIPPVYITRQSKPWKTRNMIERDKFY